MICLITTTFSFKFITVHLHNNIRYFSVIYLVNITYSYRHTVIFTVVQSSWRLFDKSICTILTFYVFQMFSFLKLGFDISVLFILLIILLLLLLLILLWRVWLLIMGSRIRFPALPQFWMWKRVWNGVHPPREDSWVATLLRSSGSD